MADTIIDDREASTQVLASRKNLKVVKFNIMIIRDPVLLDTEEDQWSNTTKLKSSQNGKADTKGLPITRFLQKRKNRLDILSTLLLTKMEIFHHLIKSMLSYRLWLSEPRDGLLALLLPPLDHQAMRTVRYKEQKSKHWQLQGQADQRQPPPADQCTEHIHK